MFNNEPSDALSQTDVVVTDLAVEEKAVHFHQYISILSSFTECVEGILSEVASAFFTSNEVLR